MNLCAELHIVHVALLRVLTPVCNGSWTTRLTPDHSLVIGNGFSLTLGPVAVSFILERRPAHTNAICVAAGVGSGVSLSYPSLFLVIICNLCRVSGGRSVGQNRFD